MSKFHVFFSIIIPTYNRKDELTRCLNSLNNQTYKNFEVIVCDDGSTDNSAEIAKEFGNRLNIRYFWQPNWGGPARPRNIGITAAEGEWLCFLDVDDIWYPEKLEICQRYIDHYDFIYHDLDFMNTSGKGRVVKGRQLSLNAFEDLLVNGNPIPNSSVCVKKKLIKEVNGFSEDRNLIAVEDYDLWLRLASNKCYFKYIPKSLGVYFIGEDNITSNDLKQNDRIKYVYERYLGLLDDNIRNKAVRMRSYLLAKNYYSISEYETALRYFMEGIRATNIIIKFKSLYFIVMILLRR